MAGLRKTREMVLHANNFKVIDHCELALALVCLILTSLNCWDCPKKQPVTINKNGQN